jgi:hypothetical protein
MPIDRVSILKVLVDNDKTKDILIL